MGGLAIDQAMLSSASGWNTVPSTQIRWRMTAIRRARATIAIFRPRRWASWAPHVRSHVKRPRFIMTVAAWHNARLRLTSPALVMPPETSRSPDWLRDGVRPAQGPTLFDEVKRARSSKRVGRSMPRRHRSPASSSSDDKPDRPGQAGVPAFQGLQAPVAGQLWLAASAQSRSPA